MSKAIRNSVCRLCAKSQNNLSPITKEIVSKIGLLFEVPIGEPDDDPLPTNVCTVCVNNVNHIWTIFKAIHAAQKLLKDLLDTDNSVETIIISSNDAIITEYEIFFSTEAAIIDSNIVLVSNNETAAVCKTNSVEIVEDTTCPENVERTADVDSKNLELYSEERDDSQCFKENHVSQNAMIQYIDEIVEPLFTSHDAEPYSVKPNIKQPCKLESNEAFHSEGMNVLINNSMHQEQWQTLEYQNYIANRNDRYINHEYMSVEEFPNDLENGLDVDKTENNHQLTVSRLVGRVPPSLPSSN